MKKIILIIFIIISFKCLFAQTGTMGDPFTSLDQAASITTAGTYYLNIGGTTFNTHIDANGYVQIAIDFGNGVGDLPQSTSLTTSSRGILTPAVLAALSATQEVRISSSTGSLDVISTNASIISRIQSNTTLHQGTTDNTINNDWIGTNANYLTNNASCASPYGTSLHQNIFHPCGNGSTFHWIPNTSVQREIYSSGEIANTTSLQIWVKGKCLSSITSLNQAASITTPGKYCFDISGVTFETYVDANGYVQIANDFGNGVGNLPQSTLLTTTSRGILTPAVLAVLNETQEVRISSSTGNVDVTSTNASIISRLQSNTTLHQGTPDNTINNDWIGTNANYFTGNASCNSPHGTSLHQNIFHPCGDASTFHWIPNTSVQREIHSSGEVANTTFLQLWVKGIPTVSWDGGAGTDFWEDPLNWDGNFLPTASDIAVIPDGITIKVSAAGAVCSELKIGNLAEFEVMTTGEITIGNDIDFQSGASINIIRGVLNLGGEIINDGSASIVFADNSTMNYNGNGTQTVANKNYYNLTLSGSGSKNLTGTTNVRGTFTNSATIGTNTGTIDYNGSGVQTITSFDYHNLTISGDKGGNTITFASALGIANSLSLTATNVTYDLSTNTNTISYNGSSLQTIQNIPDCYYNLVCENGIKQFVENIEVKNDVLIASSGTLQTAGNELTIGRHFTKNGTFTPSSSDIVRFSGTNSAIITGTIAFENLNINKTSSSVDINGIVSIASTGSIMIENGTSTLSVSGSLTLLSTSGINIARIGEIPSGSSVSGNITIQRYVPISTNTLGWWHLSNTVQGVSVSNWQSFLKISGNFIGRDSILGSLEASKDNWSLKTYDESQLTSGGVFNDGWKGFPTSTNTETFTNGKGYRLYLVNSRTASSAQTLSFTGTINQGEFTFPMTYTNSGVANSEGYAFLGNPYPSAIDFSEGNWTKTNVTNAMYIWDAQLKVWRGWFNGSNYNGGTSIIPAGQGFWVQATGTPTLKVQESAKVSNSASLQRIAQVENNINVSLEEKGSDDLVTTDIRISDLATAGYDEEYDMAYLSRNLFSEFNSIPLLDIASESNDGKKLFINTLPISGEEIIPLHITTTIGNEHVLTITKENYNLNSQVYLVDNVLNTEVLVEDVISYSFDSKLGTKDRFSVKVDNRIVLETEDFVANGQYVIYPNPATSKGFTVKGIQSYEDVTITVTDVLGNTMYKSTVENNESGFEKHVKFNNSLKAGVYVVKFTTSNNENIQKIIIE